MRLKELRQERNLTQLDVAKAINTSQRNIGRWENGENEPGSTFIAQLAIFFEVSADYLLELEDDFGNRTITTSDSLSAEERKVLENYRRLPDKIKKLIRDQLEVYNEQNQVSIRKNVKR